MAQIEGDKPKFVMLHRNVFDHCFWQQGRTFSQFEAWLDLIATARYADKGDYVPTKGVGTVWLERGQLVGSVRFLAKRWNWGGKKVRGYIERLKKMDQITTHLTTQLGTQPTTVISITNYETYNPLQDKKDTPKGTPKDSVRTQSGHSQGTVRAQSGHKEEEGKKVIREERKNTPPSTASGDAEAEEDEVEFIWTGTGKGKKRLNKSLVPLFLEFWEAFGNKRSRAVSALAFANVPWTSKKENNQKLAQKIIESAKRMPKAHATAESRGSTPILASTWLNQMRWEDGESKPLQNRPPSDPPNWQRLRDEVCDDLEAQGVPGEKLASTRTETRYQSLKSSIRDDITAKTKGTSSNSTELT